MSPFGDSGYPGDENLSDTLFIATAVYMAVNTHNLENSGNTWAKLAPMLWMRIKAGTALVDGRSSPSVCIQFGKASTGREAPLSRRIGIDVQMVYISGCSTLLNSVESAMASMITASI